MSLARRMQVVHTPEQRMPMETAIKVAFATTDMVHVNQHFGSARSFAVYAVDPEQSEMLEAAQFGELAQDGNEDKLSVKIQLLDGCAAVYCQAIGASAIKQIIAQGIQPIKVHEGSTIKDLIGDLQNEMKAGPSAWLTKAINAHKGPDAGRFDAMEDEGWDE
ncbi:nitrogen fixation protein NifX [Methylomonas sp. LWB]|uniref:Nitrogen fixation protein NifX n=2 Tax=Methylococcaceae TaxID=403 RepID=A0A177NJI2_9GAMM|nr:nitrogen fixation protein NifX [Methylomonas koyamae]OHX34604.1 nitrogen fixation protein NifX [Methylomonas sp. LWB]